MGSAAAALPATPSVFRGHVAPEWDPEVELGSRPVAAIARPGLPLSRSQMMLIKPAPDRAAGPEPGPQAPFAYHFAQPIGDPVDPTTLPQMGTHNSRIRIVYYGNSYYWFYNYQPD
jgi:hypothetical protein